MKQYIACQSIQLSGQLTIIVAPFTCIFFQLALHFVRQRLEKAVRGSLPPLQPRVRGLRVFQPSLLSTSFPVLRHCRNVILIFGGLTFLDRFLLAMLLLFVVRLLATTSIRSLRTLLFQGLLV